MTQNQREISENDQLRADIYQLLAAMFRSAPSAELLQFLTSLDIDVTDESEIAKAWLAVKQAAGKCSGEDLAEEYQNIFIGVGTGEILPYASWYLAGSLMDTPLAALRQDLMQMGFERQDEVKEPEDHVAALCEVMSSLILEAPSYRQLAFYQRHIGGWISRYCEELARAPSAQFYQAVAQVAAAFFAAEANVFEQLNMDIPVNCPGNEEIEPQAV